MRITFLVSALAIFLVSLGCFKKNTTPCDVVVSVPPYLYFVDKLMGGDVRALSLVPSGANPHLYEPSPKEIAEARQAKVWIRLSEHFEKRILTAWQEQNPNLIVVNLAEKMDLPHLPGEKHSCACCSAHKENLDLHFWLSLRLAPQQAKLIACALSQSFPEKSLQIEQNLAALLDQFQELDIQLTQKLAPYAGESILVSHPAFGYFCYDYRLKQISIEQEGKDPLPKQITALTQSAQTHPIRVVLTQAQYNNKGAEIMARNLNLPIHEVDPYSPNYLENFTYIANCIENP